MEILEPAARWPAVERPIGFHSHVGTS
jgi:hypothetical protein